MQLFNMGSETKFRVFFNELESHNIEKSLGSESISIRNITLCEHIEKIVPSLFEEFSHKRVMVLNICNERPYISAIVLVQDIDAKFPTPKEKKHLLKVTKVSFTDGNTFKDWLLDKDYSYKVVYVSRNNKIKVAIFNMKESDEMTLAQYGAKIVNVYDILRYMLSETMYKLEKCFQ